MQRGIIRNSETEPIAAEQLASLFKSTFGESGICAIADNLAAEKINNNTVRLHPGEFNLSGYIVGVPSGSYEDIIIDSGTSGQNRNDLIVAEFVRNGESIGNDTLHFTVVKGTSTSGTAADPALTQQDINAAGVTRQEALHRVKVAGTEITQIDLLATQLPNLDLVWSWIYPVGSLFETTDETFNPASVWGGTWEQYGAGRVTVGYSSGETEFNDGGKTGGAKTHTLTVAQMPSHRHVQSYILLNTTPGTTGLPGMSGGTAGDTPSVQNTQYTGSGEAHNNLQPYITVFRWRRTA